MFKYFFPSRNLKLLSSEFSLNYHFTISLNFRTNFVACSSFNLVWATISSWFVPVVISLKKANCRKFPEKESVHGTLSYSPIVYFTRPILALGLALTRPVCASVTRSPCQVCAYDFRQMRQIIWNRKWLRSYIWPRPSDLFAYERPLSGKEILGWMPLVPQLKITTPGNFLRWFF